jgi:cysteine desulfurase
MKLLSDFLRKRQGQRGFGSLSSERVYLDHAGATPLSKRALKKLQETLSLYGNPSAIYKEGVDAKRLLGEAKKDIGAILSCRPHEIYFTGTGTESASLAIEGVVKAYEAKKTDIIPYIAPHVIVSAVEHPAVKVLVEDLVREGRITITELAVEKDGLIKVQKVKEALRPETILVSTMYANNEVGTIMPIKEIGRMLALYKEERKDEEKSDYPYFHTDACQGAQYLTLDVNSLRVDLMTMNSSKVYGPKGTALLYKKESCEVVALTLGGGQERGLRSGTEATPLIVSFAEALKETKEIQEVEKKRMEELRDYTKAKLTELIPAITWYGTFEKGKRLPNNLNFRVPGITSEEMILRLDAKGFAVSHKSACASEDESMSYVIKALGASDEEAYENIRVTMGRGTTKRDMERFIAVILEVSKKYCR